jgi:hypothetical protein
MTGDSVIKALAALSASIKTTEREQAFRSLMDALLAFGSETPDNLGMNQHLDYGIHEDVGSMGKQRRFVGLRLRNSGIGVAELLNVLEDVDVPASLKKRYPEVDDKEWSALRRFVTLIVLALQREVA